MMDVAFLLDENIPVSVVEAIRQWEPLIVMLHAGHDAESPRSGTLDPEVLSFAEEHRLALVTFDKTTMPGHAADHFASGRRTWGVFIFPNGNSLSPGRIAWELRLVWGASSADEWIDLIRYLPF